MAVGNYEKGWVKIVGIIYCCRGYDMLLRLPEDFRGLGLGVCRAPMLAMSPQHKDPKLFDVLSGNIFQAPSWTSVCGVE